MLGHFLDSIKNGIQDKVFTYKTQFEIENIQEMSDTEDEFLSL